MYPTLGKRDENEGGRGEGKKFSALYVPLGARAVCLSSKPQATFPLQFRAAKFGCVLRREAKDGRVCWDPVVRIRLASLEYAMFKKTGCVFLS